MNLRASNEPCTDGTKDRRRVLAHRRMPFGADVYGERRDSERTKSSKLSAGLIGKTEPCTDGTKDRRRVLKQSHVRRELSAPLPWLIIDL